MRKKKHNADEIRFCQSRLHRQIRSFNNGDTCYLVSLEWEDGRPMRMVVCADCYRHNVGSLIKEITIDNTRVPILA